MTKRGKVLRDTTSGPGLLMIEGQQYHFSLDGVWTSEATPKPGLVVDVELDSCGKLHAITVVPESQLAREQAEAAAAIPSHTHWSPLTGIDMPTLAAAGLLAAAWFFLPSASIQSPFPGKLEFTFWEILGFLNVGNLREMMDGRAIRGAGLYGCLAIIALAGPFLPLVWKDKRALLGGVLPLLFMVIVGIVVRIALDNTVGGSSDGVTAEASRHAREGVSKAISLGLGAYLSIIACLYFALMSAKSFLMTNAPSRERLESPQQKAA